MSLSVKKLLIFAATGFSAGLSAIAKTEKPTVDLGYTVTNTTYQYPIGTSTSYSFLPDLPKPSKTLGNILGSITENIIRAPQMQPVFILQNLIESGPTNQQLSSISLDAWQNYLSSISNMPNALQKLETDIRDAIQKPAPENKASSSKFSDASRHAQLRCILALVHYEQYQLNPTKDKLATVVRELKRAEKDGLELPADFAGFLGSLKTEKRSFRH